MLKSSKILFVLLILVSFLDVASTHLSLSTGKTYEANPLFRNLFEEHGVIFIGSLLKLSMLGIFFLSLKRLDQDKTLKPKHKSWIKVLLSWFISINFLVVINNFYLYYIHS